MEEECPICSGSVRSLVAHMKAVHSVDFIRPTDTEPEPPPTPPAPEAKAPQASPPRASPARPQTKLPAQRKPKSPQPQPPASLAAMVGNPALQANQALANLIPGLMAAGLGNVGAGGAPVPCPLCGFESGSWLESLAHFHLAHATALLLPSAMAALLPNLSTAAPPPLGPLQAFANAAQQAGSPSGPAPAPKTSPAISQATPTPTAPPPPPPSNFKDSAAMKTPSFKDPEKVYSSKVVNSFIEEFEPTPSPGELSLGDPPSKKSHRCRLCGKTFSRKDHSQRHVRSFHTGELEMASAAHPGGGIAQRKRSSSQASPPKASPPAQAPLPPVTMDPSPPPSQVQQSLLSQAPTMAGAQASPPSRYSPPSFSRGLSSGAELFLERAAAAQTRCFRCKLCSKTFNRAHHVRRHMRKTHYPNGGERAEDVEEVLPSAAGPMDCAAPTMVKRTSLLPPLPDVSHQPNSEDQSQLLNVFILKSTPEEGVPGLPHLCLVCGGAFPDADSGLRHLEAQHSADLEFLNRNQAKLNIGNGVEELGVGGLGGGGSVRVSRDPFQAVSDAVGRLIRFSPAVGGMPNPPTCQFCDHDYLTVLDALRHVRAAHPTELAELSRSLLGAQEMKRPFVCAVCRVKFTRRDHCTRHIKNTHKDQALTDIPSLVIKQEDPLPGVSSASAVPVSFVQRPPKALVGVRGPTSKTSGASRRRSLGGQTEGRVKKYRCKICDRRCSTYVHAATHVAARHPEDAARLGRPEEAVEPVLQMEDGSYVLSVAGDAAQPAPIVCEACGLTCASWEELGTHRQAVHKGALFAFGCCVCDFSTTRPLRLLVHLNRRHNLPLGPNLLQCQHCPSTQRQPLSGVPALSSHRRRFHSARLLLHSAARKLNLNASEADADVFVGQARLLQRLSRRYRPGGTCGKCKRRCHDALVLQGHRKLCGKRPKRLGKVKSRCRFCLVRKPPLELQAHQRRHQLLLASRVALPRTSESLRPCWRCHKPRLQGSAARPSHLCQRDPPKPCDGCSATIANPLVREAHPFVCPKSAASTSAKPQRCRFCPATFQFPSSLERHEFFHIHRSHLPHRQRFAAEAAGKEETAESELGCGACAAKLTSEAGLAAHKELHACLASLEERLRRHPPAKPPKAKRRRSSKGAAGSTAGPSPSPHSSEKKKAGTRCRFCSLAFKYRASLEKHEAAHEENGEALAAASKTAECAECGQTFRSQAVLAKHLATHSAPSPLAVKRTCPHCSTRFKYQKSFVKHVATHRAAARKAAK